MRNPAISFTVEEGKPEQPDIDTWPADATVGAFRLAREVARARLQGWKLAHGKQASPPTHTLDDGEVVEMVDVRDYRGNRPED